MTQIIISSTQDPASTNIKKQLLNQSPWDHISNCFSHPVYQHHNHSDFYLVTINEKTILHEHLEKELKEHLNLTADAFLFVSRHRSKSGEPTLTTHPIGNYGSADFGGKPETLTPALPHHMTMLLRRIKHHAEKAKMYHKVCFEVTHHGPYLQTPTLFTEVGSTEEEWQKEKPAGIIAQSIIDLIESYHEIQKNQEKTPVLVGIGGGHYAPRFTDVAFEKQVAFAHMLPSYHINQGNLTKEILEKTLAASAPVHGVYLHRKALKKSQQTLIKQWCAELEVPVVSSNDFPDVS